VGRIKGSDKIGVRAGRVVNKHKMAKHLILDIGENYLTFRRDQAAIDAEAALDGIHVIRTPLPTARLDAPATVTAYKNLAFVERDFRSIKADDLDLRAIHHWLEGRVCGHVLICMLAAYLTWHLRKILAPLTYTDEQAPRPRQPGRPRPPLRTCRRQGRRAFQRRRADPAQLPRPHRPPRHRDPEHHRRHQLRENQRSYPRPAPRLRAHRIARPADSQLEVDRTPSRSSDKPAA
jgi:hypothetical protein